jgi:hypothetical protein
MQCSYEIRFDSLFLKGRALSFPCDEKGDVMLDALSERARANYFLARSTVGAEYGCPTVRRTWRQVVPA